MSDVSAERNPIDELAEEFAERYRQGERPALSEYIRKYPDLADEIREVFPALVMMEQLKPATADMDSAEPGGADGAGIGRPERIGDYRLLREIGRGGMGVVYEAEQVSLGRHVALKVLPLAGLTSSTYLERFRREAKAAAQLHHTNIVPVFGVGESDGVHYYAMQFIHGEGLDTVLQDLRRLRLRQQTPPGGSGPEETVAPLSVAQSLLAGQFAALELNGAARPDGAAPAGASAKADSSNVNLAGGQRDGEYYRSVARVGLQVAEALAYAHKQGILHRDIKPSNLILDLQGTVWITDFGLAKAEGSDELTHTGDIVGTVRYMAPERFDGASLPQGDVYAVSITLYEMLTLRPAFEDSNRARLIQRVLHEDLPRPRKFDTRIPRDLETIVLKAGARDPARRYSTAEALAEDLRRFLSDRPIRARRAPVRERLWRWCRRNPAVASLMGAVAALLVAVAVGSSLMALSLNASKKDALEKAVSLSASKKDALDKLWRSKLNEARATVLSRLPGQRFTSLRRIREALAIAKQLGLTNKDRLELRNAAIAALALPDFEIAKEWDGCPAGTASVAFDARLKRYARADKDGRVSIRRLRDDREMIALSGKGHPATVWLSPGARHVAVQDQPTSSLRIWRLDLPKPRCIHERNFTSAVAADFTPDGQRLVCESATRLTVVELATGQVRSWPLPGTLPVQGGVKCHPKRAQVAVVRSVNGKGLLEVRDLTTGDVKIQLWHDDEIRSHAWHPSGRLLAVGCDDLKFSIVLWDVAAQRRVAVLTGHKTFGIVVRFNHAGDRLISNDWSGTLRLWDVASGRQLHSMLASTANAAFSPDDRYLACASWVGTDKLLLLRFAAGREVRTLVHRAATGTGLYRWAKVSRDGRLVVFATLSTRVAHYTRTGVAVLDGPTGQELGRLPNAALFPLGFDPAGALWTGGYSSLSGDVLRWPQSTNPATGAIRFGPPQPVLSVPGTEARALSLDGRILVLANGSEGSLILHRGRLGGVDRLIPTGAQYDVRYGAVSPNGRWVASGTHWNKPGESARVWDAATGRLVKNIQVDGSCDVGFSPDSRWLVTGGGGIRLWRAGTWGAGPRVLVEGDGEGWAFSPDGRLLAVGGHGRVRLVRPNTGAEVARLALREQTKFEPMCFTPDGGELLVTGEDTEAVHVWDLRLIRRQLADLGLDWDDPALPVGNALRGVPGDKRNATEGVPYRAASHQGADTPPPSRSPPKVEFVGADLVADPQKMRQYRMAWNLLALRKNPFDARAHFRLGQLIDYSQPAAAYAHYTAALTFQPDQPLAYENRAVAAYRLKRWHQVIADCSQVLKQHPDRVRCLSFRAAAYQWLGRHTEAVADLSALVRSHPRDMEFFDRRASNYKALGQKARAKADRRRAGELAPDDARQLNARAWQMLTGPQAERDAPAVLKLAQRAVHLVPSEAHYVNTLGMAQYRNGLYRKAVVTLERSLALGNGKWDAFDLFFLAMCHQKLGEPAKARDCFDRAVRWCRDQKALPPVHVEELKMFPAEAEAGFKAPVRRGRK